MAIFPLDLGLHSTGVSWGIPFEFTVFLCAWSHLCGCKWGATSGSVFSVEAAHTSKSAQENGLGEPFIRGNVSVRCLRWQLRGWQLVFVRASQSHCVAGVTTCPCAVQGPLVPVPTGTSTAATGRRPVDTRPWSAAAEFLSMLGCFSLGEEPHLLRVQGPPNEQLRVTPGEIHGTLVRA